MSRYDIMHEHDNNRHAWPALPDAFIKCNKHKYMAIIERLHYSLERVPSDYNEMTFVPASEEGKVAQ
jgi:hypothetical protein